MLADLTVRSFYDNVLYSKAGKGEEKCLLDGISDQLSKEKKFSFAAVNEQFMKSVKIMENVVLVPTRLMDLELGNEKDRKFTDLFSGAQISLFDVFHLLKMFRDKMQAMAVTDEEELSSPSQQQQQSQSPFEVDEILLSLSSHKVTVDCDSGLWSLSSAASRESIEEDLGTTSNDDRSSTSSGDSEACSLDSTHVVKQSLHSAKSLCSFLSELTKLAHHVVAKYLQEMQCDLCE